MALVGPPSYFPLGFNQLTLAVPVFQLNPSYFATTPVSQSIISLLSEFKAAAVSYHFNWSRCDPLLPCLPPVLITFSAQGSSHCAHHKPFSTSHPSRSKITILSDMDIVSQTFASHPDTQDTSWPQARREQGFNVAFMKVCPRQYETKWIYFKRGNLPRVLEDRDEKTVTYDFNQEIPKVTLRIWTRREGRMTQRLYVTSWECFCHHHCLDSMIYSSAQIRLNTYI